MTTATEISNAFAAAAEKGAQATVLVNARQRMPASGIAIAADLILTANHAVERDEDISVLLPDGTEVAATLAGRDPASDLAVLRLAEAKVAPAETTSAARVGELVLALGRPTPGGIEASLGTISAIGGPVRTPRGQIDRYFRTDTTPFPGFSGGPLVNAAGQVLGLNTSGFGPGQFITLPMEFAAKIAEQLAKHGSLRRGYLGIRSQTVEIPAAAKREQATGLLVVGVETGTPAEKGGLMVGDIILTLNGSPVQDHDDLFMALSGDIVGQPAPLQVLRGGQPHTLTVTIEPRPEGQQGEGHHRHGHHGHR